jgi:methionine synthase II (cobalamin-independent)
VQKRYDVASGKAQPDELIPLEDKSVAEVVKFQKDCGISAVSSGEYTRFVV